MHYSHYNVMLSIYVESLHKKHNNKQGKIRYFVEIKSTKINVKSNNMFSKNIVTIAD